MRACVRIVHTHVNRTAHPQLMQVTADAGFRGGRPPPPLLRKEQESLSALQPELMHQSGEGCHAAVQDEGEVRGFIGVGGVVFTSDFCSPGSVRSAKWGSGGSLILKTAAYTRAQVQATGLAVAAGGW